MDRLAQDVYERLSDELGDALVAVGYYDQGEYGTVYRRPDLEDCYTESQALDILEGAALESLGQGAYELPHGQPLHATFRVYENVADVTIPVEETRGVVFALDRDEGFSYGDALDTAEAALGRDLVGVPV